MTDGERNPWEMTYAEVVASRPRLTDKGRAAIDLPRIPDVALVPLVDLPWYRDRKAES